MSTVFGVPCPKCGGQMTVEAGGDLDCPTCHETYHVRMGHLFPVGHPRPSRATAPIGPAPATQIQR